MASPTRFAIIADVHMRERFEMEIERELEAVVGRLEESDIAQLFVLGDLIEDGSSRSVDRANVARVSRVLGAASVPVTYLLGNHDVVQLDRSTLSRLLDQPSFTGVTTVSGCQVIRLDTTATHAEGAGGGLGAAQRRWLGETLDELDRPIVLSHHPIGRFDLSENVWFRDDDADAYPCDRVDALSILDAKGPVQAAVSGHLHQTACVTERGGPHVSVSAFSKDRPEQPVSGTYAVVDFGDDASIEVRRDGTVTASYRLG